MLKKTEQKMARSPQKQRSLALVESFGKLLEALTLRHRLIDAAWESAVLSQVCCPQLLRTILHYSFTCLHLQSRTL